MIRVFPTDLSRRVYDLLVGSGEPMSSSDEHLGDKGNEGYFHPSRLYALSSEP